VKPGDLIFVNTRYYAHSYPSNWVPGTEPFYYTVRTPVIYLSEDREGGLWGRVFYKILTPTGVHKINSKFCEVVE
jgi:hypothetical protein